MQEQKVQKQQYETKITQIGAGYRNLPLDRLYWLHWGLSVSQGPNLGGHQHPHKKQQHTHRNIISVQTMLPVSGHILISPSHNTTKHGQSGYITSFFFSISFDSSSLWSWDHDKMLFSRYSGHDHTVIFIVKWPK